MTKGSGRRPVCPRCGADNVVPIVYGLPGSELAEEANRGEVSLGGCYVSDDDPNCECKECEHKWRAHE